MVFTTAVLWPNLMTDSENSNKARNLRFDYNERVFPMRLMFAILFSPIALSVVILFLHLVPDVSGFLSNVFWSWLGDVSFFPMIIDFIQKYCSHETVRIEELLTAYFSLMVYGALDAIFMGCCIFVIKSIFTNIRTSTNKGGNYDRFFFFLPGRGWIPSLIGVLVGVSLQPVFGFGSRHIGAVLKGALSIALLVYGIIKIWTAGEKLLSWRGSDYERVREKYLLRLLFGILINAFQAIAVANVLTLWLEFGRMLRAGAHLLPMAMWLVSSILLVFLCNLISRKNK